MLFAGQWLHTGRDIGMNLKTKIMASLLAAGLVPAAVVGTVGYFGTNEIKRGTATELTSTALQTIDTLDRNIFERYGDVQAFGLNGVVQDRTQWYRPDASESAVVRAMNDYVACYGLYYLTLLVDPQGKVIAVNTLDAKGKSIDTASIYATNFANESWLADARNEKFLKSDSLTGTVVDDVHVSPFVKTIYKNDGLAMGFTAPVKDADGNVIAYWHNLAKWELAEEIVASTYTRLSDQGWKTAELTLLDSKGRVLIDCDPTTHNGQAINRNMSVVLNLNLAEAKIPAAMAAVAGETGSSIGIHARKGISQLAGYAPSKGALGYPGVGWSLLIRLLQKCIIFCWAASAVCR
jgi:hypothetical protein